MLLEMIAAAKTMYDGVCESACKSGSLDTFAIIGERSLYLLKTS